MNYKLKKMMDIGRINIESIEPREEIGYINFHISDKGVEIRDLWINFSSEDKNFRGKGYGSVLVREVINHAKDIKAKSIFGHTQIDDTPVHSFYRKHGFIFEDKGKNGGINFHQPLN